jgi:ABC-type uncharacterized transport system YnjBCD permease subunit
MTTLYYIHTVQRNLLQSTLAPTIYCTKLAILSGIYIAKILKKDRFDRLRAFRSWKISLPLFAANHSFSNDDARPSKRDSDTASHNIEHIVFVSRRYA